MPYHINEKKKHCPLWPVSHFPKELQTITHNNWRRGKKKPLRLLQHQHAPCDAQEKLMSLCPC
jgi:hypothetical protein